MPPLMVRPPEPLLKTINRPAARVMLVPIASSRMPSHLGVDTFQSAGVFVHNHPMKIAAALNC